MIWLSLGLVVLAWFNIYRLNKEVEALKKELTNLKIDLKNGNTIK